MAVITAAELATAIGSDAAIATRLLAVTGALVDRYLAGADIPEAIRNEAIIMASGWRNEVPTNNIRRKEIGEIRFERDPSKVAGNILRLSGAMALLAPYKVRRAGAIKSESE